MKAILRKEAVACAAMLMSANVLAQSFDMIKEYQGNVDIFSNVIGGNLTIDGVPSICIIEKDNQDYSDPDGRYILSKASILNKNLGTVREFTSGPLFEECIDSRITAAPKSKKVLSVEKMTNLIFNSYSGHTVEEEIFWYNDDYWQYVNEKCVGAAVYCEKDLYAYAAGIGGEAFINKLKSDFLDYYRSINMNREVMTYDEKKIYFFKGDVLSSEYFDWGIEYPLCGIVCNSIEDMYYVWLIYETNEYGEVFRTNYTYSISSLNNIGFVDFDNLDEEQSAMISQNLFNDNEKYEFILPVMEVFESSLLNANSGIKTIEYKHRTIGFKIVSEDGSELYRILINEDKDEELYCSAMIVKLGDKQYLVVDSRKYDYNSGMPHSEVIRFYEIKKDGTGIEKVREMSGSMNIRPTVANRDEQITITLNDENSNVARELIITGVNGQLVDRRDIPAGENTVTVSAAMMRSGMYNFTLQKKGEIMDNGKVIVK